MEPLKIYRTKKSVMGSLIGTLIGAGLFAFILFFKPEQNGNFINIFGIIGLGGCGLLASMHLYRLSTISIPMLVIDEEGITDKTALISYNFIPWKVVASVEMDQFDRANPELIVTLHDLVQGPFMSNIFARFRAVFGCVRLNRRHSVAIRMNGCMEHRDEVNRAANDFFNQFLAKHPGKKGRRGAPVDTRSFDKYSE